MAKQRKKPKPIDHGTPETRAKLPRRDVVGSLASTGLLNQRQYSAANDLLDVVAARHRMSFGSSSLQPRIDSGRFSEPIDRLSWEQANKWQRVFLPWESQNGKPLEEVFEYPSGSRTVKTRKVTYTEVTYAIVVENFPVRQYEDRLKLPHGIAMKALRRALDNYADLAEIV